MESLIYEIQKLGLSEKEAQVYIALLELGPSTPYRVSKKAHLKRPTAYVIAEELVQKGLLVRVLQEKKKTYIARSIEVYVSDMEKKLDDVKKIVPELVALQRKTSEQPNLLYFEGISGLKQAYEYKLEEFHNTEILGLAAKAKDFSQELLESVVYPWNDYRERHNIRLKVLTVDDEKLVKFRKYFNDRKNFVAKFLPEVQYSADCTVEVFGWGVRIVMVRSLQALIIESTKLAATFRQVFELLWEELEGKYDYPQKFSLQDSSIA
jgi:sugar-specific transcriptional regulator TrmB